MKRNNIIAAIACAFALLGCSDGKKQLHVYTWADYIDHGAIEAFETANDCKVVIDTFESNEAAYAKLKAGASGYDVIFPSSYQVAQLVKEDMLEKLDLQKLPNVSKNFDHTFDTQVLDPQLSYSIPYAATYTGYMCLADKVSKFGKDIPISAIADAAFKNKVTLLDDMREVVGLGLMHHGYSLNSTNKLEIEQAAQTVLKWKNANVRKFDAESYKTEVASKSVWIGHGYSADAMQVILDCEGDGQGRDDIVFLLPKEGFTVAWDEMAIMKDSKEKELAYKFIDILFDGDIACANMQYISAVMANKDGLSKLPENIKKAITLTPEQAKVGQVLRGFENQPEVQELYNRAWDEIRSTK